MCALQLASTCIVSARIGNDKGTDKGNKNGWKSSDGGCQGYVPHGLNVSGDNGRTDNNGENPDGNTPNKNGEDSGGYDDPN